MENIKENIAYNITELRKAKNISQAELGNVLSYSDKTISKWERCESMPDIETLLKIASYFDVDLNFLLSKHESLSREIWKRNLKSLYKKTLITSLLVLGLLFVSICVFMYGLFLAKPAWNSGWLSFIYFFPISCVSIMVFMRKYINRLAIIILSSILLWSAITSIYLSTLIFANENFWLLYISGAPIQAAIILIWFFKFDK